MLRLKPLKIYDKGLGKVKIKNLHTASDDILSIVTSNDGSNIVASTFDQVFYFSEGKKIWTLNIDNFNSFSMSKNGKYLVIGTLSRLIYMDAPHFNPSAVYKEKTKELPLEKKGDNYWILPVTDIDITVISSDGKSVVVGGEKTLYFYNNLMERLWTFEMGDKIWGVSISEDCNIIVAGSGKEMYYFDRSGKLLWQFRTGSLVRFPSITPDGKRVLASSNKKLYMFTQRGQLLSEVDTGTSQTLGSSRELETIAGSSSTVVFCYNEEGKRLWEKEEKDFINMIRVTGNGEGVIVGSGSDILNNPTLQVYHKDGTLLWSYFPGSQVKCVATDETGHYVIAGIGRKIKRFDNTVILTRTSITVSDRCRETLNFLKSKGIDVVRQEEDFTQFNDDLQKGKSQDALHNLLSLERTLTRIKERYQMAKETIPNWLETLGITVEITDELINGIFPLYNKYVDINDNTSIASKRKSLDLYIRNLKKALESVDPTVLVARKKSSKKPILKQKLSVLSTTLDGISGLNKVVKNLQTEKINFIFELEDTTRNVILDHLSGKNYEKEITDAIEKVEEFEEKIESLIFRIQKFETTIKMWREQENMRSPDSVMVEIKNDTREKDGAIDLVLSITNNYESPITKVNIRSFSKDSIFNYIEPDHGVVGPAMSILSGSSDQFWARFRSDVSINVVVNGILIFELERVEYQVKLPPINISLLSPSISPLQITEVDYSKQMEKDITYQESIVLRDAELTQVMRYLKEKLKRFQEIRNKPAITDVEETRIMWFSGKFGKSHEILVTIVVRKMENQDIEIGSSVYATDKEKGTAFVQDLMNYFKMNYKMVDTGN